MGPSPTVLADQVPTWETPTPLPPLCLRCPLLSGACGLSLALLAEQFPALADGVLSFQAIVPYGPLDRPLPGVARGRAPAGRQRPGPERGYYGCPECENRRGVRPYPWL